ncbi:MAG: glycoside hydrolase family 3 N-terminal domain-containing protein [Bacteroidales bacterium]|nr:glycoside hydrolase family 3 N-terminal domain-containing protein [Bacteroidales bacterium]MDY6000990.1 glycoside hydrolase family 3 N-terminal domain-containing protein [Candidatus Cryptobacteroides sp.]
MKISNALSCVAAIIALISCSGRDWRDVSLPAWDRAEALLREMTLEEKIGQMCQFVAPCYVPPGQGSPYKNIDATDENLGNKDLADKIRRGEVGSFLHVMTSKEAVALQQLAQESRLKIPLLIGIDAVHGNALLEGCTVYPTNINMASTFNPSLMEKIGAETADEMRQTGACWTFSPNLDVSRDARWGRMGETFGEDPLLVSEMGKYLIWGLQGRDQSYSDNHVLACAKHFIAGGEPRGGLNASPMDVSEGKMREVFLPPFVAAVNAGVATMMPAHNEINGIPCHANSWLQKDLLRDELGFKGFTVSDWMDIERLYSMHHFVKDSTEAFITAVEAGVDIHMQGAKFFEAVREAVKSGRIPEKRIDDAVRNILTAKFALGLFENPVPVSKRSIDRAAEHRQTALEAARQGIVLLKNDSFGGSEKVLPLRSPKRIFLAGPNADSQTILGDWAAPQADSLVTTVYDGMLECFPDSEIDTMFFGGRIASVDARGISDAASRAAAADACVLVLGDNSQRYSAFGRTCGENCDRDDIDFPGMQEGLLEAVASAGKPVVLVIMSGRALSVRWAAENIPAILETWEPGSIGGQAIAEILCGKVNPSGKLPVTIPRSVGQIPTTYDYKGSQYSRQYATSRTGCLFPFGYGLSYSKFTYSKHAITSDVIAVADSAIVSVDVTNDGPMDGDEVVQLYVHDEYASVTRPLRALKAFRRVHVKAGETVSVQFTVKEDMLRCWSANGRWEAEPGDFKIFVGSSSADKDLTSLHLKAE